MPHLTPETIERVLNANRDFYNSDHADKYDDIHPIHYAHYSQKIMRREIRYMAERIKVRPIQAIDIASGTGNFSMNLLHTVSQEEVSITAVDIAEKMLEKLSRKIYAAFPNTGLRIAASDVETFISRNTIQYDLVGFASAIHHFPDYRAVFEKCAELTAENGFLYIHQEPLQKNYVSKTGTLLNLIDTRAYFCFNVFKKDGMPFYKRWLKLIKTLISLLINRYSFTARIRNRLSRSPRFQWLYNDGVYSDERMQYVEFHEEGIDKNMIIDILLQKGYTIVQCTNAPDKHYRFFYFLSRLFKAPSHFSLIARRNPLPKPE